MLICAPACSGRFRQRGPEQEQKTPSPAPKQRPPPVREAFRAGLHRGVGQLPVGQARFRVR